MSDCHNSLTFFFKYTFGTNYDKQQIVLKKKKNYGKN